MSVYLCILCILIILILVYRFVNNFYPPLKPLFIADPMLLYDFIYICPEDDFQSLFRKIPAYLSLTWLPATRRIPFYVEYVSVYVCI